MKTLDRYVTRIFLSTFGVVILFVLGLFVLINLFAVVDDLLEVKEELAERGLTVIGVLSRFYLLSLPFNLTQLMPFATLIAATITLVRLIRGNEITPMIASGRSPDRIALPIYVFAALTTLGMLAFQEWGAPRLARPLERLELLVKKKLEGDLDDVPPLADGYKNTWKIARYYPASKSIEDARVVRFKDPDTGEYLGTLQVGRARFLEDGPAGTGWYPEDARLVPAENPESPAGIRPLPADRPLRTDIHPRMIEMELKRSARTYGKKLSISEAHSLALHYPDLPRQTVAFHALITWPLGNLLLVLLGLPFIFRMGERNLFVALGIAGVVGAAFLFSDTFCQDLGSRAAIPPAVAAWLPIVAFVSVAIAVKDALRS